MSEAEVKSYFYITQGTRKAFLESDIGKKIAEEIPPEVQEEIINIIKSRLAVWKCRCGKRWMASALLCPHCNSGRVIDLEGLEFET